MNRRKKIDASVKRDPKDRASLNAKKSSSSTSSSKDEKSLQGKRSREPDDSKSTPTAKDKTKDLRDKIPKLSRTITQDGEDTGSLVIQLEESNTSAISLVDPSYGDTVGVETFDYSHGSKGEKLPEGSIDPDVEVEKALKKLYPRISSNPPGDEADLRSLIEQQRDERNEDSREKKGAMSFRDTLLAYGNEDKEETGTLDYLYSKRRESESSVGSRDKYASNRSGKRQADVGVSRRSKRRDKSPDSPSGFDLGRPFFSSTSGDVKNLSDSADLRAALKELAYLRSIQSGEYSLPKEEDEYFRKLNDLSRSSLSALLDDDKHTEPGKKRKLASDFKSPPSHKSRKDSEKIDTKWDKVVDKFIERSGKQTQARHKSPPASEGAYGPVLPPNTGTLYSDVEAKGKSVDRQSSEGKRSQRPLKDTSPPFSNRGGTWRGYRGRGFRGFRGGRGTYRGRGRGRGFRGQYIRGFRGRGAPVRGRHIFGAGSSRRSSSSSSSSSSSHSSQSRDRSHGQGRSSRQKRRSRNRSSSYSSDSSRSRSKSHDRSRRKGRKRSQRRSRSSSYSSDSRSRSRSRDRSRRRRSTSVSNSKKGARQDSRRHSRSRSWSFDEDYTKGKSSNKGKHTTQKKDVKGSHAGSKSDLKGGEKKYVKYGSKPKLQDNKCATTSKETMDKQPSTKTSADTQSKENTVKTEVHYIEKTVKSTKTKGKGSNAKEAKEKSETEAKVAAVSGVFLPRTITKTIKGIKLPPGRNLKAPAHPAFRVPVDEEDEVDNLPLRKEPPKSKKPENSIKQDDISNNEKFKSIFESEVDKVFGSKQEDKIEVVKEKEETTDEPEEALKGNKDIGTDQQATQDSAKEKEKMKKEKKKKDKEEKLKRKKEKREKKEKKKKKPSTDMFSSEDEEKKSKDEHYDNLEGGDHDGQGQSRMEGIQEGNGTVQAEQYQEYYEEGTEYYDQSQEQGWYDENGEFHQYQEGEVYYYDDQGNIVEGYEGGQVYGEDGQVADQFIQSGEAYYGEECYNYEGVEQGYPAEQVYVEGEGEALYIEEQTWGDESYVGEEQSAVEEYGYEAYQGIEGQEYAEGEQYVIDANTWEGGYPELYTEGGSEQELLAAETTYPEGDEMYAEYQYDASQVGEYAEQGHDLVAQPSHWDQHQGGEENYVNTTDAGSSLGEKPQVIEYGHSGFGRAFPGEQEGTSPVSVDPGGLSRLEASGRQYPRRASKAANPSRPLKSILKKGNPDAPKTEEQPPQAESTSESLTTSEKPSHGEHVGPEYIVRLADHGNRQFFCKLCNCYIASLITKELHAKSIKHVELFVREKSSLLHSVLGTTPKPKEEDVKPTMEAMQPSGEQSAFEKSSESEEEQQRPSGRYDNKEGRYSSSYKHRDERSHLDKGPEATRIEEALGYGEQERFHRDSSGRESEGDRSYALKGRREPTSLHTDERPDNRGWQEGRRSYEDIERPRRWGEEDNSSLSRGEHYQHEGGPLGAEGREGPLMHDDIFKEHRSTSTMAPHKQYPTEIEKYGQTIDAGRPIQEDRRQDYGVQGRYKSDSGAGGDSSSQKGESHRVPLQRRQPQVNQESNARQLVRQPHREQGRKPHQPDNEKALPVDRRRPPQHQRPSSGPSGAERSIVAENRSRDVRLSNQSADQKSGNGQNKKHVSQRSETPGQIRREAPVESSSQRRVLPSEVNKTSSTKDVRKSTREPSTSNRNEAKPPNAQERKAAPGTEKQEKAYLTTTSGTESSILGEPPLEVKATTRMGQPPPRGRGIPTVAGGRGAQRGRHGPPPPPPPYRGRGRGGLHTQGGRGSYHRNTSKDAQPQQVTPPALSPDQGAHLVPAPKSNPRQGGTTPVPSSQPHPVRGKPHAAKPFFGGALPGQLIQSSAGGTSPAVAPQGQAIPAGNVSGGMRPSSNTGAGILGASPAAARGRGSTQYSAQGRQRPPSGNVGQDAIPVTITGRGAHQYPSRGRPSPNISRGRAQAPQYHRGGGPSRGRGGPPPAYQGRGGPAHFRGRGRGGRGAPFRGRGHPW